MDASRAWTCALLLRGVPAARCANDLLRMEAEPQALEQLERLKLSDEECQRLLRHRADPGLRDVEAQLCRRG